MQRAALATGADCVVAKPIDIGDLPAIVNAGMPQPPLTIRRASR
jgi:hypothetical protein